MVTAEGQTFAGPKSQSDHRSASNLRRQRNQRQRQPYPASDDGQALDAGHGKVGKGKVMVGRGSSSIISPIFCVAFCRVLVLLVQDPLHISISGRCGAAKRTRIGECAEPPAVADARIGLIHIYLIDVFAAFGACHLYGDTPPTSTTPRPTAGHRSILAM